MIQTAIHHPATHYQQADSLQAGRPSWTSSERFVFRVAFIFFILLIIPLSGDWYQRLLSIKTLGDFFSLISGYRTNFMYIATESGRWGIVSFFGAWGLAFILAVIGAGIWTLLTLKQPVERYDRLYYWLRVLVRYRIAAGLIAFGYLKVFPMQMPFPSLSNLNTNFGDYSSYKIYWQSVGISQWYEIFLGFLEVGVGILFFFRGTTALGAILTTGILYNISHANLAYDGGVHVYSAYFALLSVFLLLQYLPNIYKLLIRNQDTIPDYFYPEYPSQKRRYVLLGLKFVFIISFVAVSGYNRFHVHYHLKRLKEPVTPGLQNAAGYYNVTEFRLNDKVIPYSPLDTIRWQDAVFEKYSTLTYRVSRPISVDVTNGGGGETDVSRNYELSGIGGGRKFFYYETDTVNHVLQLQDKNTPRSYYDMYVRNFGRPLITYPVDGNNPSDNPGPKKKTGKPEKPNILHWHYDRPSDSRIVISGINETGDSITVTLDRLNKKYPLIEGREFSYRQGYQPDHLK